MKKCYKVCGSVWCGERVEGATLHSVKLTTWKVSSSHESVSRKREKSNLHNLNIIIFALTSAHPSRLVSPFFWVHIKIDKLLFSRGNSNEIGKNGNHSLLNRVSFLDIFPHSRFSSWNIYSNIHCSQKQKNLLSTNLNDSCLIVQQKVLRKFITLKNWKYQKRFSVLELAWIFFFFSFIPFVIV